MFRRDVDGCRVRMLEKGDGCLLPEDVRQTRKMLCLQLPQKFSRRRRIHFCEKACTYRLCIRFMLPLLRHLWRMTTSWRYCSEVRPADIRQNRVEFWERKESISEDRPFPPYPVLSRQRSCEVDREIPVARCGRRLFHRRGKSAHYVWGGLRKESFLERKKNMRKLRGRR